MLRVLTYNIHSGVGIDGRYDLERLGRVVRRSCADIVCLQEVESNLQATSQQRSRVFSACHADDQPATLGKAADLPYSYFFSLLQGCLVEGTNGSARSKPHGEILEDNPAGPCFYGNAILSRFPILQKREWRFERLRQRQSATQIYMDKEEQPRGAMAILVRVPAREEGGQCEADVHVWILNTHLSHKLCTEEQRNQARQVRSWALSLLEDGPGTAVVVCGDLNSSPATPRGAYGIFRDGHFKSLWAKRLLPPATFHSKAHACNACLPWFLRVPSALVCGMRLDNMFTLERRSICTCLGIDIMTSMEDAIASDHMPVYAQLQFTLARG